jgi:hypothetical protein
MTDVGKKLSVGLTAPLALFAGAAINSAVKADRLQKTLDGLAGGAENAAKYIDSIKDASLGTIPKVEALAIANRALSFGVVKNTDEMAKLTKVAIALGRAQGLDATTAVSDLTTALSRNSPMILDNLGITLKLTEAYRIYADKIGVSADALNEEQKAMAFREAALIKGMEVVERMGGLQDDMASSGERLKAQMSDMAVTVGQALIPVLQKGLDIIGPLVNAFNSASPAVQQLVVVLGGVAAAAGPALSVIGKLTSTVGELALKHPALNTALSNTSGLLTGLGVAGGVAIGAYVLLKAASADLKKQQEESTIALQGWIDKLKEAKDAGAELEPVIEGAAEEVNKYNAAWAGSNIVAKALNDNRDVMKDMASDTHTAIIQVSGDYDSYIALVEEHNKTVQDSVGHIREQTVAHTKGGGAIKTVRDEMVLLTTAQFELATGTGTAAHEMRKLEQGYRGVSTASSEYNNQLSYTEPELKNITAATESFDRAMLQAAQSTKDGTLVTDEHKAALIRQYTEQRKVGEVAERVAAMQEESAARTAAALQQQQAAAEEAARGQAGLISSMKDATQEMFNQQILAAVDPAEVGVEAWAALGQELGLLDQTQVNLATAAEDLIGAFKDGAVPTENMAEAAGALFAESEKLEPKFGEILDHFAAAPGLIGPSKDELDGLNEKLALTGEVGAETEGSIKAFADQIIITKTPVRELKEEADDLYDSFYQLTGKSWEVSFVTSYSTSGTPPSPPTGGPGGRQQMGGVIPGRPGSLQGPYWLHGGEVVSNPYQYGAVGGPGGPPAPTNNYGGDTFNVNINDRMAAALFLDQMRRQRGDKLNARM